MVVVVGGRLKRRGLMVVIGGEWVCNGERK